LSLISSIELSLDLPPGSAATHSIKLDAADIDALIAKLAHHRSAMTPEVSREGPNAELPKVVDPLWILHAPAGTSDKLLLIRHPGLGWMMFQLPAMEAGKLGQGLLAETPRPEAKPAVVSNHLH
jgi:hypothetical protein